MAILIGIRAFFSVLLVQLAADLDHKILSTRAFFKSAVFGVILMGIMLLFLPAVFALGNENTNVTDGVSYGVPSIDEFWESIKGGASIPEIIKSWNPFVADQLKDEVLLIFEKDDLESFVNSIGYIIILFFKYVFRQSATLVPAVLV